MEIKEFQIKLGVVKLGLISKRSPETYTEREKKAMKIYKELDSLDASLECLKRKLI